MSINVDEGETGDDFQPEAELPDWWHRIDYWVRCHAVEERELVGPFPELAWQAIETALHENAEARRLMEVVVKAEERYPKQPSWVQAMREWLERTK